MSAAVAVALAVVVPLIGALADMLLRGRAQRWAAACTVGATVAVAFRVAWFVSTVGVQRLAVGGWGAPLGIELRADGLAALLLVITAVVGALCCVPALLSRAADADDRLFTLWFFAWAALNALVLSADVFNLYVTLELTTLSAVGLIALSGAPQALRAAVRYLLFALCGSMLYLLGVALLYGAHATLELTALGTRLRPDALGFTALGLMTVGLCLKAALFPLHGWLPPAYAHSRPTISALLSAVIGKGAFYVLLRLWLEVFPNAVALHLGSLIGALGAGAVLWGSVLALRQRRLKALIAYSSVAQIGYLFLPFAIASSGGFTGGIYLAISHAAAKASMFIAAGALSRAFGHDDLEGLRGMAHIRPLTYCAIAIAGVSLMGMPPSGGFVAKWLLLRAAIEQERWWLLAVIIAGGLLAAAYIFKVLRGAFDPPRAAPTLRQDSRVPAATALALAVLSLLLGLLPAYALELLAVGRTW